MPNSQIKDFELINKIHAKASNMTIHYWQSYSNLGTWQFWVIAGMVIVPLIALYFFMDRKKALLIGFFGFNVHVWFHYIDAFGIMRAFWNYPYNLFPLLIGFSLDAALIPVVFMFVYQWTLNKNKNFYLYATALSAFLSFLFKPTLVTFGFFKIYKGLNYFHLFLLYIVVFVISKLITNIFLHFVKEGSDYRKEEGSSG
jgi:hypothetical protein